MIELLKEKKLSKFCKGIQENISSVRKLRKPFEKTGIANRIKEN